jgi:hypothetical protein
MTLKQRWHSAQGLIKLWLQLPQMLVRAVRELFVNGGFELQTPLIYCNDAQAIAYQGAFRTVLQIDGDIINVIPPPDLFAADVAWQQHYQQAQQQHQRQFQHILEHLSLVRTLSRRMGAAVGTVSSALSWGLTEWHLLLDGWPPYVLVAALLGLMLITGALLAAIVHFGLRPLFLRWLQRRLQLR